MRRPALDISPAGWAMLIAMAVLLAVGIGSIYVTDTHYAAGHDGPRNAARQCVFVLVGVIAAIGVLHGGYPLIARHAYAIFLAGLALLLPLTLARVFHTAMGGLTAPRNGAYRWIHLPGYQLQPSEFMKIAFVLALAWYLRYRTNVRRLRGLLLPMGIAAVPLGLILLEPDLGTVLLLTPVFIVMVFVAGARVRHLALLGLVALAAVPLAWQRIEPYQRLRVTAVLLQSEKLRQAVIADPARFGVLATRRQAIEWAAGSGYQLVQSQCAIGSGAALGQGWGQGVYVTSGLLPDRHNDFIFAIVAHQWGFVGCVVVLACFSVIVVAGLRIASATTEPLARLLAVGVVTLIAAQAIINVGMASGVMPTTGMTLPFVSYGGSSLLTSFVGVALLISIAQHRPYILAVRPLELLFRPGERPPHMAAVGEATRAAPAAVARS
ncbi:MAG: rod shape-determining protein RodA [Planctomycetes bacterium]|nr:rod shape-determining protein RodA [Planctomycetota bacterium]